MSTAYKKNIARAAPVDSLPTLADSLNTVMSSRIARIAMAGRDRNIVTRPER